MNNSKLRDVWQSGSYRISFSDEPIDFEGTLEPGGSSGKLRVREGRAARRVLVIDDSDSARATIMNTLRDAGYEVWGLPSAIGATRMAMKCNIDAAVIDISMPGLSGDKLVGVFRSNAHLGKIIIVLVSGCELDELDEIGQRVAVDGVLQKSRTQESLVLTLGRLFAARSMLGSAPTALMRR